MLCPNCNTESNGTNAFCPNCGTPLPKAEETAYATQAFDQASQTTSPYGTPQDATSQMYGADASSAYGQQYAQPQEGQPYGQAYGQQYQQQYQQPYQQPYVAPQPSGTPFVLSIVALVTAFLGLFPVSIILAIIALIMNSGQKKQGLFSTKQKPTFVMSIISIIVSILVVISIAALVAIGVFAMEEEGYSINTNSSGNVTITTPSSGSITLTSSGEAVRTDPSSSASSAAASGTAVGGSLATTDSSAAASSSGANPAAQGDNNFVGMWEIDSMRYDGEEMGASELNMMREMGMNVTLELRDDGKASLMLFDEEMAGTWKLNSENSISVTFEGDTIEGSITDGILSLADGTDSLNFHVMV